MTQIDKIVIDATKRLNYPIEIHQLEKVLENELNKVCDCSSVRLNEREIIESRNVVSEDVVVWFKKVVAELVTACDGIKVHKLAEIEMLTINDIVDIILSFNRFI